MVACSRLPLRRLEPLSPWLLGAGAALLLVVAVIGRVAKGAMRWLDVGLFSIQPTDLARLAAVVVLAWWVQRRPPAQPGFARRLPPAPPPAAWTRSRPGCWAPERPCSWWWR